MIIEYDTKYDTKQLRGENINEVFKEKCVKNKNNTRGVRGQAVDFLNHIDTKRESEIIIPPKDRKSDDDRLKNTTEEDIIRVCDNIISEMIVSYCNNNIESFKEKIKGYKYHKTFIDKTSSYLINRLRVADNLFTGFLEKNLITSNPLNKVLIRTILFDKIDEITEKNNNQEIKKNLEQEFNKIVNENSDIVAILNKINEYVNEKISINEKYAQVTKEIKEHLESNLRAKNSKWFKYNIKNFIEVLLKKYNSDLLSKMADMAEKRIYKLLTNEQQLKYDKYINELSNPQHSIEYFKRFRKFMDYLVKQNKKFSNIKTLEDVDSEMVKLFAIYRMRLTENKKLDVEQVKNSLYSVTRELNPVCRIFMGCFKKNPFEGLYEKGADNNITVLSWVREILLLERDNVNNDEVKEAINNYANQLKKDFLDDNQKDAYKNYLQKRHQSGNGDFKKHFENFKKFINEKYPHIVNVDKVNLKMAEEFAIETMQKYFKEIKPQIEQQESLTQEESLTPEELKSIISKTAEELSNIGKVYKTCFNNNPFEGLYLERILNDKTKKADNDRLRTDKEKSDKEKSNKEKSNKEKSTKEKNIKEKSKKVPFGYWLGTVVLPKAVEAYSLDKNSKEVITNYSSEKKPNIEFFGTEINKIIASFKGKNAKRAKENANLFLNLLDSKRKELIIKKRLTGTYYNDDELLKAVKKEDIYKICEKYLSKKPNCKFDDFNDFLNIANTMLKNVVDKNPFDEILAEKDFSCVYVFADDYFKKHHTEKDDNRFQDTSRSNFEMNIDTLSDDFDLVTDDAINVPEDNHGVTSNENKPEDESKNTVMDIDETNGDQIKANEPEDTVLSDKKIDEVEALNKRHIDTQSDDFNLVTDDAINVPEDNHVVTSNVNKPEDESKNTVMDIDETNGEPTNDDQITAKKPENTVLSDKEIDEVEALNKEENILIDKINKLLNDVNFLNVSDFNNIKNIDELIEFLQDFIMKLREENGILENDSNNLTTKISELNEYLKISKSNKENMSNILKELESSKEKLSKQNTELEKKNSLLDDEIEKQESSNSDCRNKIADTQETQEKNADTLETQEKNADTLETQEKNATQNKKRKFEKISESEKISERMSHKNYSLSNMPYNSGMSTSSETPSKKPKFSDALSKSKYQTKLNNMNFYRG